MRMFTEIQVTDERTQNIMRRFTEKLLNSSALTESKVLQQLKAVGPLKIKRSLASGANRLVVNFSVETVSFIVQLQPFSARLVENHHLVSHHLHLVRESRVQETIPRNARVRVHERHVSVLPTLFA